jgi:dihydropteroate synthase
MTLPRFRPLVQSGAPRPPGAVPLAGGPLWFDRVAVHEAGRAPVVAPALEVPAEVMERLAAPRPPICGLRLDDRPLLMGVLNVTPDSFSDGGRHLDPEVAVARAREVVAEGAEIIDIGGESTRPGSDPVPAEAEAERVVPVIRRLREAGLAAPVSVDTRKAAVARAAVAAGAGLMNDVSALTFDPEAPAVAASLGVPLCLMHAQGDPKTMQDAPGYGDVLLEVYDFLEARVAAAEAAGIPRGRILVDPGIGFGKTAAHNLALVRGLALFHGLGCAVLLGVSRKRFIGIIGGEPEAVRRAPGSIAVALEGLRQGAQVLRIHDVRETRQAVALWWALNGSGEEARGEDG